MKFFAYNQNNSGGTYMGPLYVIVQARNDEHANSLATLFTDVHFNMSSSCECCGPRWQPEYGDGENLPSDVWVGPGYREGRADAPLCVNALGDVVERSTLPMDVDSFDSDPFWVK